MEKNCKQTVTPSKVLGSWTERLTLNPGRLNGCLSARNISSSNTTGFELFGAVRKISTFHGAHIRPSLGNLLCQVMAGVCEGACEQSQAHEGSFSETHIRQLRDISQCQGDMLR
jgi:hypothetical protein